MNWTFKETSGFSAWARIRLTDEMLRWLQLALIANPELGDVMPGCGGLRKVRVRDERKRRGKRGGLRIVYLHVPESYLFYLLDGYGKDEKGDLGADEKKLLRELVGRLRTEAKRDRNGR